MNRKITHLIPSIIFYVFACLLAVYAVWAYTHCADIISQAKAAGQLATRGNEYDIASFYMGNCSQYLVFALLLAAAGLLLQRKITILNKTGTTAQLHKNSADDEELDDWFNEMNTDDNSVSKDE